MSYPECQSACLIHRAEQRVIVRVTMEAAALYNFDATGGDELSFRKGDVLKVCIPWGVLIHPIVVSLLFLLGLAL